MNAPKMAMGVPSSTAKGGSKRTNLFARPQKHWPAPVNDRNGTVHVQLKVLEKPAGGEPIIWSVCSIPNQGQNHGYGCLGISAYKETGIYEQDIAMTKFWQNDDIVWSEGIKQMDLVIKDGTGTKAPTRPAPEKFFPTKLRMTLLQVSAGAKYDPKLVPNLPLGEKKQGVANARIEGR